MQDAKLYVRSKAMQVSIQNSVLKEFGTLLEWDKPQEVSLLDIGCGDGDVLVNVFLPAIPRSCKRVLGVDILPEMDRIAGERHGTVLGVSFAEFDVGTKIEEEVTKLGVFSHVVSFLCLHWLKDQRLAFRNIHKLLQPGGQLFATMIKRSVMDPLYAELAADPRWQPYMHNWTDWLFPYWNHDNPGAVLNEHLKSAGFTTYQVHVFRSSYQFKSRQEMKYTLQVLNVFAYRMPLLLRDAYMDHLVEMLRKRTGMTDNVKFEIIVLHAIK